MEGKYGRDLVAENRRRTGLQERVPGAGSGRRCILTGCQVWKRRMSEVSYQEFDGATYTQFRKDLLREKGSSRQREFLGAVRESDRFIAFLRDLRLIAEGSTVPLYDEVLSEQMYREPPPDVEEGLYRKWSGVAPRYACSPTFWAAVTSQHIEGGKILSSYLAVDGSAAATGAQRIDRSLASGEPKRIDDCVRSVIRRMSGLPEARGNRSMYVDCPLARAWWRERLVARVTERSGVVRKEMVRDVVRRSKDYWEKLIVMIVSRSSVFGSTIVVDAFVASLARLLTVEPKSALRETDALVRTVRKVSALGAGRELGVLEFSEIVELMDGVIWDVHQAAEKQQWKASGFRAVAHRESRAVAESVGELEDQAFIDAITDFDEA
jgi:hypothetical protein